MRRFRLVFSQEVEGTGVRDVALEVRTEFRARELAQRMLAQLPDRFSVEVWEGNERLFSIEQAPPHVA